MSHGITSTDTMFSVRETPWHRLGAVLAHRPAGVQEALTAAGLDWPVTQQPITVGAREQPEPQWLANVRSDTGTVLGIVSRDYRVVDNVDAFRFLSGLIGSELHFETGGSLWGGRQVFVCAELPDHITVGGDAVRRFVLVTTSHTGTGAVRATVTPIRVVCNNTLRAALDHARSTYRVTHLGDPNAQLHEAREVLGMTVDYYRQFARMGDGLALEPISERRLAGIVGELWPQDSQLGSRAQVNRLRAREGVLELFRGGETIGNAPGSKWSAWNAIGEYHDHHGPRPRTAEGAFLRRTEDRRGVKAQALALLQAA